MSARIATRLAWLGIAVAVIGLGVVALFVVGSLGLIGGGGTATPKGNFSVAKAQSFRGFPVYYPGESVNGYPLTAVARDPLGPLRKNQESVLFMYGTCKLPPGEGGCSLPVSVSNEPACSRNLGMYGGGFGSPVPRPTRIRGATGSFFEGGSRLELQTGTTTVVIFAFSKRKALSVAKSLRGANVPVSESDPLPGPARGALEGNVPCPR
jgi:hypothetical protein